MSERTAVEIEHLDGVAWHAAPIPRRWHWCRAQTSGWYGLSRIERCACGAIRYDGRAWMDRNARSKTLKRAADE
jgi:hypothetical protein